MSDRDAAHTLTELQEARAEIDRLREVVLEYKRQAAQLVERVVQLDDYMRWRTCRERPEEGTLVIIILKGMAWPNIVQAAGKAFWESDMVTHWRPIGPLPGGE